LKASTQAIRTELKEALATATNRKDIERLKEAIKELDDTLNLGPWTPDGNHVACERGAKVFDGGQGAVKNLVEMIRDTSPGISDATIQRWINILVAIDRNLAQTAITEANDPDAPPKKIADALEELAKGDADASRGDYDKAIEHYERAWKGVRDCGDDDAD
jgi:tetratricopeptide (TPR) repeat protein